MEPEKRLLGDDDLTSLLVVLFCILAVVGVAWLAYNPLRPKIPRDCNTITLTDSAGHPCAHITMPDSTGKTGLPTQ